VRGACDRLAPHEDASALREDQASGLYLYDIKQERSLRSNYPKQSSLGEAMRASMGVVASRPPGRSASFAGLYGLLQGARVSTLLRVRPAALAPQVGKVGLRSLGRRIQ
jgi:hypothetical protein